jgi:hypothetical protein
MRVEGLYRIDEGWPVFVLVTDTGAFRLSAEGLELTAVESVGEDLLAQYRGLDIDEIRAQSPNVIAVRLSNGVVAVVAPVYDPEAGEAWLALDVQRAKEADEWADEWKAMKILWPSL